MQAIITNKGRTVEITAADFSQQGQRNDFKSGDACSLIRFYFSPPQPHCFPAAAAATSSLIPFRLPGSASFALLQLL